MPQPSQKITITIENQAPVELLDFTKSLLAIGDQFKRDVEDSLEGFEGKLYVSELRKGSLVAVLEVVAAHGGQVMSAMEATKAFVGHISDVIEWLKGRAEKPAKADARRVSNISTMLEPVAKDNGSNITIAISGNNMAPITINTADANAAQNRANRFLQELKSPEAAIHTKQLLYWDQVRNQDGPPRSGEKAMIDALSDRPVKVVFDNRQLREEMLYTNQNPLQEAYIVDVEVQTVRGRIMSYKVLQLHERIVMDESP